MRARSHAPKADEPMITNPTQEASNSIRAVSRHACKLGCEGIVSKRLGSRYRSGRSPRWLKMKNPEAPAVKRERQGPMALKRLTQVMAMISADRRRDINFFIAAIDVATRGFVQRKCELVHTRSPQCLLGCRRRRAISATLSSLYFGLAGCIWRGLFRYEPTREAAMAAFAKSWRRE